MANFATSIAEENEIIKADDITFGYEAAIDNVTLALRGVLGSTSGSFVIGGTVTPYSGGGLNVSVAGLYAYCAETEVAVVETDTTGPISFEEEEESDRIDIIEVQGAEEGYDYQVRMFNDPSTGTKSSESMNTKKRIALSVAVKKGTAGSAVAPSVDEGWVKLAEVRIIAASSTIQEAQIANITAREAGEANEGWTADAAAAYNPGELTSVFGTFLVAHNSDGSHKSGAIEGDDIDWGTGSSQVKASLMPVGRSTTLKGTNYESGASVQALLLDLVSHANALYPYANNLLSRYEAAGVVPIAASTENVDIETGGALALDGVAVTDGQAVLLKDQADAAQNGIWRVNGSGAWTRYEGYTASDSEALTHKLIYVSGGKTNAGRVYYLEGDAYQIGTDSLEFKESILSPQEIANKAILRDADGSISALTATGQIKGTTLASTGNATVGGNLEVAGTTSLAGGVTLDGAISAKTLSISSTSTLTGAVTVGSTVTATGNITSSAQVQGATVKSTGATTVGTTLTVGSTATISGAATINGATVPSADYDQVVNGVYHVYTLAGLQAWRSAAYSDPSTSCVLHNSIDMTGASWGRVGSSGSNPYTGTFDGGGHTLYGFTRSVSSSAASSGAFCALFHYFAGTVKNLNLVNASITATYTAGSSATARAGGIAAYVRDGGVIENCTFEGTVTATSNGSSLAAAGGIASCVYDGRITNCHASGTVTATNTGTGAARAGGIVGHGEPAAISHCSSSCTVSASDVSAWCCGGGIAGYLIEGGVSHCSFTGTAGATSTSNAACGGGIAGNIKSAGVSNCANSGSVTSTSSSSTAYGGGIVGYVDSGSASNCANSGTVTATSTSSTAYGAGIAGYIASGSAASCENSGTVTATASGSSAAECGGIAGYIYASMINACKNSGAVSATSASGSARTGGIAGNAGYNSAINGCLNSAAVTGKSTGNVGRAGGIGTYYVSISGCVNRATITATGSSSSDYNCCSGGIVGYCSTNSSSYYNGVVFCVNSGSCSASGGASSYTGYAIVWLRYSNYTTCSLNLRIAGPTSDIGGSRTD